MTNTSEESRLLYPAPPSQPVLQKRSNGFRVSCTPPPRPQHDCGSAVALLRNLLPFEFFKINTKLAMLLILASKFL